MCSRVRQMMSRSSRILYRKLAEVSSQALNVTGKGQRQESESSPPPLMEVRGVIFDMDGTLTIPVLNFLEMKAALGLAPNQDILPTVQTYPPAERAKAMAIIEKFEDEGIRKMQLQPGVLDLMHCVAERGVARALMTRNSSRATEVFLSQLKDQLSSNKHQYPSLQGQEIFSQVLTRDYEPCKPNPAPALHVCKEWGMSPDQVVVVGDDKVDMLCGLRAGLAFNILLRNSRNEKQKDYSNFTVKSLSDIILLFSSPINVVPKYEDESS